MVMSETIKEARHSYLDAPYGLKSWLLTRDHKRIAMLYLISITIFFMRGFKDDQWGGRWSERLKARGLDIDFDHFDTTQLDALLGEVGDVSIDVDDGRATVRIVRE